MDDIKIFEVKCNTVPVSELPVGAKEARLDTEFDKINPQNKSLDDLKNSFKYRIAGVMMPRDPENMEKLET